MTSSFLFPLLLTASLACTADTVSNGQEHVDPNASQQHQEYLHAHQKIHIINRAMQQLSRVTGKGLPSKAPLLNIDHISVLELEMLTMSMYEKLNRLEQQLLRSQTYIDRHSFEQALIDRKGLSNSAHIDEIINKSFAISTRFISALALNQDKINTPQDAADDMSKKDIFIDLLTVNRLINHLLFQPYRPADTYRQVSRALAYWSSSQAQEFPNESSTPPNVPFEAYKTPRDVYQNLLVSGRELDNIATKIDIQPLNITSPENKDSHILPADVYDLSFIILGRVILLGIHTNNIKKAIVYPYPGVRFPSHVYQRVSSLNLALKGTNELILTSQKNQ